jgi:hypothetical protein
MWHRLDSCVRAADVSWTLPEGLAGRSGRLIYLSLGSLGSADVGLMQRLVDILGRTAHRVIVSKGPLADQIVLPDNMTGEGFLPQPAILPQVDLVITTAATTRSPRFHHGKPMIVLPSSGTGSTTRSAWLNRSESASRPTTSPTTSSPRRSTAAGRPSWGPAVGVARLRPTRAPSGPRISSSASPEREPVLRDNLTADAARRWARRVPASVGPRRCGFSGRGSTAGGVVGSQAVAAR